MIPNGPSITSQTIPLETAGEMVIQGPIGYLHLWQFENAAGALDLDGTVSVTFGSLNPADDDVPLGYNSRIQMAVPVTFVVIRWAAQPGRRARLLMAPTAAGLEASNIPARQLVTVTNATTLVMNTTTVGLTSASMLPNTTLRLRGVVQSDPANTGLIGLGTASSVTLATAGVILRPGDSFEFRVSMAVWGISDTAAQLVRRYEERA